MDNMDKPVGVKKSIIQLIKFGLVGVLNTLIDLIVYNALVWVFKVTPDNTVVIALFNIVSYSCGVLNSFLLNTHWTFKAEYKRTKKEAVQFVLVNIISCGLSYVLQMIFSRYIFAGSDITTWVCQLINFSNTETMVLWLSKLIATPIVIVLNFLGNKLLVFNK